jgi:O-antigen/teichoic acid export membrane protein
MSDSIAHLPSADSSPREPSCEWVADSLAVGVLFALVLTALQRVIGLVRGLLFCRLLPEDELGLWSLAWSYLMLLAPLAVLGLPGSFGRFVEYYRQRGQLGTFLRRMIVWSVGLGGTLIMGLALLAEPASVLLFRSPDHAALVRVMAVTLVAVIAYNFLTSLLEALRQIRLVSWMRLVSAVAFAIVSVAALVVVDVDASAVTWGFGVASLLGMLPALWVARQLWRLAQDRRQILPRSTMWRAIVPFAAWMWVVNLLTNLFEVVDRYFLLQLADVDSQAAQALVGQYHSGRLLPLVLVGLASMLAGLLMPYITAAWEQGRRHDALKQLQLTLKLVSFGFTAAGLATIAMAPYLFGTILEGRYSDGLAIMPLALVASTWYSLVTVGQDCLWCSGRGHWACLAVGIGLVACIVLNVALIPPFGLWGAVWATALANAVALVVLLAINTRFGWHIEPRVWLAALAPLILLLPLPLATALSIATAYIGLRRGWLLEPSEIVRLVAAARDVGQRFGWRRLAAVRPHL